MLPSLCYLAACVLSGYAVARLGPVLDRVEEAQRARMIAAIQGAPERSLAWAFISDLLGALLLSALFLVCLILAFSADS